MYPNGNCNCNCDDGVELPDLESCESVDACENSIETTCVLYNGNTTEAGIIDNGYNLTTILDNIVNSIMDGVTSATPSMHQESFTSNVITNSSAVTFSYTTNTLLALVVGQRVRCYHDDDNYMEGVIDAVNDSEMTITMDYSVGSGTYASWDIFIAGEVGEQGDIGDAIVVTFTSTTSTDLTVGIKTFDYTLASGTTLGLIAGQRIRASNAPSIYMEGVIDDIDITSISMTVDLVVGASGTYASWNIGLAGDIGSVGPNGDMSVSCNDSIDIISSGVQEFHFTNSMPNLKLVVGQRVRAANTTDPTKYMEGLITAIDLVLETISIDIDRSNGTGNFTGWDIFIIGDVGDIGDTGVGIDTVEIISGDLYIQLDGHSPVNLGQVEGEGLIQGGNENQILVKQSGTDYDTAWKNPTIGFPYPTVTNYGVVRPVIMIETEEQLDNAIPQFNGSVSGFYGADLILIEDIQLTSNKIYDLTGIKIIGNNVHKIIFNNTTTKYSININGGSPKFENVVFANNYDEAVLSGGSHTQIFSINSGSGSDKSSISLRGCIFDNIVMGPDASGQNILISQFDNESILEIIDCKIITTVGPDSSNNDVSIKMKMNHNSAENFSLIISDMKWLNNNAPAGICTTDASLPIRASSIYFELASGGNWSNTTFDIDMESYANSEFNSNLGINEQQVYIKNNLFSFMDNDGSTTNINQLKLNNYGSFGYGTNTSHPLNNEEYS